MYRDIILNALSKYGASLSDSGFIIDKGGKETGVRVLLASRGRNRMYFCSKDGFKFASGRITEEFISNFVEKFWFWEKDKA